MPERRKRKIKKYEMSHSTDLNIVVNPKNDGLSFSLVSFPVWCQPALVWHVGRC